jgi:hypothetical protein
MMFVSWDTVNPASGAEFAPLRSIANLFPIDFRNINFQDAALFPVHPSGTAIF